MQRFDRFEVQGELARGSMGVVLRARDTTLQREVALKLLPPGGDAEGLLRFQREAEAMARLRHPNLVQVHGAGVAEGRPYIVMSLIEGEPLASRLRRDERFAPREAVRLALGLARGLAAAHALGLVHRDVKPGNVIVQPDGEPVLIDFGLVRDLLGGGAGVTQEGDLLGTPAYMSPEQALGHGSAVGPPSDVFAVGATLHHLLSGAPPFRERTVQATVERVISAAAPPLPGVDPGLAALVRRCLEKDPARRPPDGAALARELETWLAGGTAAPSARGPLLVGGAALAVLVGTVAALVSRPAPRPDPAPRSGSAAQASAAAAPPVSAAPAAPPSPRALARQARDHREAGELDQAEVAFTEALSRGLDPDLLLERYELRVLRGDLAGARADFAQLEARGLRQVEWDRLSGQLREMEQALRFAEELFARATSGPTDVLKLENDMESAADWLDRLGEAVHARRLGDAMVELAPWKDDGYEVRARATIRLGRPADALDDLAKLVVMDAADPDPWLLQARALDLLGRRKEALSALRKGLSAVQPGEQAKLAAELSRLEGY